jgi:triosephosphate isomerase
VSAAGRQSGRVPLIAGNWKMHKTIGAARALIEELLPLVSGVNGVDIAVCPAFPALGPVVELVRGSRVRVYAQNMHHEAEGAYTGEVAPPMLSDLGVDGVILGHSERRQMFGETDRALQLKVPAALAEGLVPVLCVGETEEERDAGETERKLRHQVQEDLARVPEAQLGGVVIAYEPIWAIGTGRVASAEQCQEAIAFIRALVADRSREQAERVRLLYGGSVNPDNAAMILAAPDVDGALVGGASLRADSFSAIVAAAA